MTTPQIDQYTVTLTSTTQSVKIAGFPGPFQVINNNTQATVWLADNSQVKTNNGIPLNPGSSLTWTGSQNTKELWAILGTDSQSVGQTVYLSIGASVQGWQQNPVAFAVAALNAGVILVDSPIAVIPLTSLGPGSTILPSAASLYDVTTLQSVIINYTIDTAHAHTVILQLQWYAGPNGLSTEAAGIDQFLWASGDNNNLSGRSLPVRGSFLKVTVTITGASTTDSLAIYGSHRPWLAPALNLGNRLIAQGSNAGLASGASLVLIPSFRYDGPVMIGASSTGAAAHSANVRLTDTVNNIIAAFTDLTTIAYLGTNVAARTLLCVAPRNSWTVALQNGSAGAASVTLYVAAAPEGT